MSTPPTAVCALVLAGRRPAGAADPVAASAGVPIKAFVPINGRSMLERVVSTLRACPSIAEIHVSLPDDVDLASGCPALAPAFADGTLHRVAPQSSPSASVRAFATGRVLRQTVLVTTADHPLLTREMVEEFLRAWAAAAPEAAVALTDAPRIAALYPGARRTQLRFADGSFTGCNLFGFQGPGALRVLDFWGRLDGHRKQPWRFAQALGWTTLSLYLAGRLTLAAALARLSERSACRLHGVRLADPHAGIDVNKLDDLRLATWIIEQRENAAGRAERA